MALLDDCLTQEFLDAVISIVGASAVATDLASRTKASADWAKMSPILAPQLPLGLADVVAYPSTAEMVGELLAVAFEHRVPVTPRGKGTGNYGQATPMRGGMVIDTTKASRVVEVTDGTITAEAGITMAALEAAAAETGQQIWIFPSTVKSSLGGFLAGGSGGTGSVAHGQTDGGFVVALDVAHLDGSSRLHHVENDEVVPYVHAYGTSGFIARATVRTEPAQEWRALYASFDTFVSALDIVQVLAEVIPCPRLISADTPTVAAALPTDPAIPHGRTSLRTIVDERTVDAICEIVGQSGGRVEAVRHGVRACQKMSLLSYNHPTWHLQKSSAKPYFHLEVIGDALIERYAEVDAVYDGSELHIEGGRDRPNGMLNGFYESREQVYAGIEHLQELGVRVHSPHEWAVDKNVDLVKSHAALTDPYGLLNPGKLL